MSHETLTEPLLLAPAISYSRNYAWSCTSRSPHLAVTIERQDGQGEPLSHSCSMGSPFCGLQAGADAEAVDSSGARPIEAAAEAGAREVRLPPPALPGPPPAFQQLTAGV